MRGYAMIGLDKTKTKENFGGALRAAHCFGAAGVVLSGRRFAKTPTDTTAAWKHMPLFETEDIFNKVPFGCATVAVDILPGAVSLPAFKHPERAFYIFGGEDQTLDSSITERCDHSVSIPTSYCLNLAAAVNVILYDRCAKAKEVT